MLRVLGNLLGLPGFDAETVEDVRRAALGDVDALCTRLDNAPVVAPGLAGAPGPGEGGGSAVRCERLADVPLDAPAPIVRRAPALQQTADARE
ncbi:MAG: NADH-quinone oxidoreductase subunit G, partial [Pseudomonadota bacterium]